MTANPTPPKGERWWLSPEGRLLACAEHEFFARHTLRGSGEYHYGGVRQTYADFFALGWVRVVREANRIVYENPAGLTEEHGAILAQLAREQKLPLVRVNGADGGVFSRK